MKNINTYILSILALSALSACQSVKHEAPRPEAPRHAANDYIDRSGVYGTDPTYLGSSDDFLPDSAYTDLRNRNNFVKLNLNLNTENSRKAMALSNINPSLLNNILQNAFEKTKRFSMLSPNSRKQASIVLDIDMDIVYSEKADPYSKAINYDIVMTIVGYNPDRQVQEFALNKKFSIGDTFKNSSMNRMNNETRSTVLMSGIEDSFASIIPELYKYYPITGNVLAARDTGSRIVFNIDRGSEDGIKQGMPFVIAYNDAYAGQIFVANGKANAVSTNSTQIILDKWNPAESKEVANCKASIANQDLGYIENMFIVSKYRQVNITR